MSPVLVSLILNNDKDLNAVLHQEARYLCRFFFAVPPHASRDKHAIISAFAEVVFSHVYINVYVFPLIVL